jgi:TrmH family RNA methyltransferase
VEGVRLVEEALGSGGKVEAVLFSENGEKHRERLAPMISRRELGFPVLRTTDRLFEGIADTEHPQGVAALVVPRVWTLEQVLRQQRGEWQVASGEQSQDENRNSKFERYAGAIVTTERNNAVMSGALLVVLAGVQDPGNVGTILRTAAAFGATGAVTAATGQSGTASPFAPKALRASAGAALHLPIVSGIALGILLAQLKLHGIRTLATCVGAKMTEAERKGPGTRARATSSRPALVPWEVDWSDANALLVGNEGAGLPEDVVKSADQRVHIPLATRVESLNAASATAVLLYEAYRQRKSRKVKE